MQNMPPLLVVIVVAVCVACVGKTVLGVTSTVPMLPQALQLLGVVYLVQLLFANAGAVGAGWQWVRAKVDRPQLDLTRKIWTSSPTSS